ncbi:methylmalonyl-CoA mutase subunit beta [Neobacillus niacini]|uniref:methylmalonyl-CoA mutase subunit beta n=1 Tax=Neobacillus niacini TaxID=86668 RepID=UPI0028658875|nr:methylmalonyl-CoA mutase subunit beta [Neobacillus niacini]MDR6998660.1 methylmalonyl-CoA mutase [Neobacillus niacini]
MEDLRNQSFPSKTKLDWNTKAEESLKGKSVESLQSPTYENIVLKPLYFKGNQKTPSEYPGESDFRRGTYPLGYVKNDWKVAQRTSFSTINELREKLTSAVSKGQTAISFEISKTLFESDADISSLFMDLAEKYPIAIDSKGMQAFLLSKLSGANHEKISGYIGSDPISLFSEEGILSEEYLQAWSETIKAAAEIFPNLRTILINISTYQNNGANAVQELGIAAATGVFYLQQLFESGMELEEILPKMIFQFSIGSNFFMEIAKLRAARIIWSKITEAYGAGNANRGMEIAAETSTFTKTIYDPHVNLLRAGNEAFAAVIGGIQYLHVGAFDEITGSNSFSERISRNTQLILKEEAHLKNIIDPAGGSWYIEELTTELAEKAWEFFQQIETNGGILETLQTGWLQNEIAIVRNKRMQDSFTRKQSIIGTNVYANLDETVPTVQKEQESAFLVTDALKDLVNGKKPQILQLKDLDSNILIEPLAKKRLAEPYEGLRKKAKEIEERSGPTPFIGMICLGEIKQYKARFDFMRGFVSAGGIKAIGSEAIFTKEQAENFVTNQKTQHFCLCGHNDQYETIGNEILKSLKAKFPDRVFYLAGLPEKDQQSQWKHEGIEEFIHVKSHCFETLSTILSEMEVKADAKA